MFAEAAAERFMFEAWTCCLVEESAREAIMQEYAGWHDRSAEE